MIKRLFSIGGIVIMARNLSAKKRREIKQKKLNQFQVAELQDDGRVLVRSTEPQQRNNFGIISALGRDLHRLLINNPPFLPDIDRAYLVRHSLPLFVDRAAGVVIY